MVCQWYIAQRWQEYEGEARANLLRMVAIAVFYLIHLLTYYEVRLGPLEFGAGAAERSPKFHLAVSMLAVAWTTVAMAILVALRHQIFPGWLKYFSVAADVVLLTAILITADGAASPLTVGYFLVIVLATLRFSLPLVRCATVGSMLGYGFLLGASTWFKELGGGAAHHEAIPRYAQIIMFAAVALTGIVLGQVLRRMRRLADEFASRIAAEKEERP